MSSRLFQEIREKRGLAYSVYSLQASYCDAGVLGIYVGTGKRDVGFVLDLAGVGVVGVEPIRRRRTEVSERQVTLLGDRPRGLIDLSGVGAEVVGDEELAVVAGRGP